MVVVVCTPQDFVPGCSGVVCLIDGPFHFRNGNPLWQIVLFLLLPPYLTFRIFFMLYSHSPELQVAWLSFLLV